MRKLVLVAAIAAVIAMVTPSQAGVQVIVASPGSTITGVYDGPTSVAVKAAPLTFVNLDPLGSHNVVSDAKRPGTNTPVFKSGEVVAAGGTQTINLTGVALGTYSFTCSAHGNMHGTLMIVA